MRMRSREISEQFVNEAESPFVTMVREVTVFGLGDQQIVNEGSATITWELVLDYRTYGLKELNVVVNKISASYEVTNLQTEQTVEQKVTSNGWEIETEFSGPMNLPLTLVPKSVEIYPRDRRMLVQF
jgi:hypothetical protein